MLYVFFPTVLNPPIQMLPYRTTDKLAEMFDPPGHWNWRALIVNLPRHKYEYSTREVNQIEEEGNKRGASSTRLLLRDLECHEFSSGDLKEAIQKMGHRTAFAVIDEGNCRATF